jgi:hypothetical protein
MAQEPSLPTANPGRRRHLMLAPGGLHRIVPIRSALKTRKETMSGISRSPRRKPGPAIRLEPRTITSTPNIISGRCRRTAKRHSDFVAVAAGGLSRPDATIPSAQLFGPRRRLSTTGSVQVTPLVRAFAVVEALAQASAVDLKFLSLQPRVCVGTSNPKTALES